LHEFLGELIDRHLNDLIINATEIADRHLERTSTRAYRKDLLTLGIGNLLRAPPRTVQKRLTKILQELERNREEIALAGRLLDELKQELEDIDTPRHVALKDIAKVRDQYREVPDSIDESQRRLVGEVEGFSL
jgi:chromosome segregation ATPase